MSFLVMLSPSKIIESAVFDVSDTSGEEAGNAHVAGFSLLHACISDSLNAELLLSTTYTTGKLGVSEDNDIKLNIKRSPKYL